MAKRILLADDSITIQKVVELTFSEGDYEVTCASDGAQAIRKIEELVPDIALVDVMMPQRNGYDVCAHIKKDPHLAWIPVLLLTGTFEPYDPKRAEDVGADGHIVKPFESRALVGQVEELIARHPRPGAATEAKPSAPAPSGPPSVARPAEAGPRPAPAPAAPPAAAGPATVRIDSRAFFAQTAPAPSPAPARDAAAPRRPSAPTPSLGPLDLDTEESPIEPTRPLRAASPAPAPAPVAPALREADLEKAARQKVEELARPIIEKAAEKVIQEIAWEVIPDLAETIIRHRIKELEEEAASQGEAPLH